MNLSCLNSKSSDADIGEVIVRLMRDNPGRLWVDITGIEMNILADKLKEVGLKPMTVRAQGPLRPLSRHLAHAEFLLSQESSGIQVSLLAERCLPLAHSCDCTPLESHRPSNGQSESLEVDTFRFDETARKRNQASGIEFGMFEASFGPCE